MSYSQRTQNLDSPFAQIYQNSGDWTISDRPDTITENWLTASGTNGYSFVGSGFIFGFLSAGYTSIGRAYIQNDFYTSGDYANDANSSWGASDDQIISYGNNTEHSRGAYLTWNAYTDFSRFNVIRIED